MKMKEEEEIDFISSSASSSIIDSIGIDLVIIKFTLITSTCVRFGGGSFKDTPTTVAVKETKLVLLYGGVILASLW